VSVEANGVVGNHAEQHSRGRLRGLLAAGQSAEELRVQIAQFQADTDSPVPGRVCRSKHYG
jgi:hypothetical protein